MNMAHRHPAKTTRFPGKLSACLCVLLFGLAGISVATAGTLPKAPTMVPAAASTAGQVPVAQQPLTIRQKIPPNIVLMLDDSGSMAWDVMPDYSYLQGEGLASQEDLINSAINGLYYNPAITYTPPPKAEPPTDDNDEVYPPADFTDALVNGFDSSSDKVNLSTYEGQYDTSETGADHVQYSITLDANEYTAPGCPSYAEGKSQKYPGYCYFDPADGNPYDFYDANNGDYYIYRCNNKDDIFEGYWKYGNCISGEHFFTYTTGTNGNYTRHYVGETTGECTTAGLSSAVCTDSDAARQNVANWFSYYHTRILMAKSGLMNAFVNLNPTYRVGFGSINGNAIGSLPSKQYEFDDASGRNGNGTGRSNNELAEVAPFGSGASGTQKANLWNWILGESASGGTPLRLALMGVGKYYTTAQPWEKSSDDSTELACRQSYVILTTDGFWNGPNPDVGNVDDTPGDKITGPNGENYQYEPAPPYSGPYNTLGLSRGQGTETDTLADVAMYYWNQDLMSNINNEVPTNAEDPAFWQHMVTFTIGLGFQPTNISPSGTTIQDIFNWANNGSKDAIAGFKWPQPDGGTEQGNGGIVNNIADLAHAAVNGHGGFYSATSPQSFVKGLTDALARAKERTGSGASLAANSTELKTGTEAYQALYHTVYWTGDLGAYSVDATTGKIAPHSSWTAVQEMPAAADRVIYTYNPSADKYLEFKDNGSSPPALSSTELAMLGTDTASQASMVDYLRGNQSQELNDGKGLYRDRKSVLGDIVDSQPVYVGASDPNTFLGESFTGSTTYPTFTSKYSDRTGVIYVAANDGMLHGFNASTGQEVYAFLPAAVITHGGTNANGQVIGVSELADPAYGSDSEPHQYFNDGQLTVADAYFAEGSDPAAWHTVLVGTTGRGLAETIYALDVTDPTSPPKFLWERSAWDGKTNSGFIGQMTGQPIIAQVANGQWAVLIGNGYNSAKGTAALLQFNLSNGDLSVHQTDGQTANGLAAPAVWIGDQANGISTVAYAGDLKGRVWSFQLSDAVTNNGTTTVTSTPTSDGTIVFTATNDAGQAQPITAGMLVGKNPATGNLWLFFGTGRYLAASDIADTDVQSWYGLIVQSTADSDLVTNLKNGRSALAKRSIIAQFPGSTTKVTNADGTTSTVTTLPTRVISPAAAVGNDTESITGKSGWYIDLETPTMNTDGTASGYVAEGERMVGPNQFQGSRLIGTTRVPKSTDLCNPSGTGWIMAIEPFTGTNPKPQFFDVNGDGIINGDDLIHIGGSDSGTGSSGGTGGTSYAAAGVGLTSLPNTPIFVGSNMLTNGNDATMGNINTSGAGGNFQRVSWREMVNP